VVDDLRLDPTAADHGPMPLQLQHSIAHPEGEAHGH
jgi:hypothetical protein